MKIELRTELTQVMAKSVNGFFLKGRRVVVNGDKVVGVLEHEAVLTAEMLVPSAHVPFCTKEAMLLLPMIQPTLA